MSAIAGAIAFEKQDVPLRETARAMLGKMEHRGNQDEGYLFFQGNKAISFSGQFTNEKVIRHFDLPSIEKAPSETWLVLAHRLGCLYSDVHPANHQPHWDERNQLAVILDGEIFNAPQLARDFQEKGISLITDGHAELLAAGYRLWGEAVLSRLEGSFSFVLFDQRADKIFAARDPFGIKPFYYCQEEGIFAFASELKALFGLPFVSKKMSKSAVFDYLMLGESETHIQTIFRGLSELMPGSAMMVFMPKGNIKIWTYFQVATDSKMERYSRNKVSTLAHRLRKAMVQNVSDHLSPGYRTAYRMNEELESIVFPYLLKESIREMRPQERPDPSEIYSGFFQEGTMESRSEKWIRDVSEDLGIQLYSSNCTYRDFTENLLRVVYLQDVPFTSLSVFHQHQMLAEASRAGIKLVLEPAGGPQLFASGRRHLIQFLDDHLSKGNYSQFFDNLSGFEGSISEKTRLLFLLGRKLIFKSTSDDLKESLIRNNQEEYAYLKDSFKDRYFKNLDNKIKSMPDSLNQLIVSEIHGSLVKEQLRTSDRNSQAAGVEIRFPYLCNRALAEPVLKASSIYKIREGKPSNLLHKAMRGLVPEFASSGVRSSPYPRSREQEWLREASEELKVFITPDLDDFIDSRRLRMDWEKLFHSSNPKRLDFLWRVINLGIWRHVYFN
jgi:asparagine synthase (glutamine-hydrolysing)